MRINVNIDDGLKSLAEQKAHSMGLSLSAFVRFLLARETENFRSKVDSLVAKAEREGYEDFSIECVKKDLAHAKKARD